MAQEHECATVNAMVIGSIPNRGIKYLVCDFPRSGNEIKHDVVKLKVGNDNVLGGTEHVNTRFPGSCYLHYCVRDTE